MNPLAQQTGPSVPAPDIAWSSFAPEMVVASAALLLLLLAVAGRRRQAVALPAAAAAVALGAWLIVSGHVLPGLVAVACGGAIALLVIWLADRPRLIHAWLTVVALASALALTGWQYTVLLQGGAGPVTTLGGSVAVDGIALFTRLSVYVTTLLVVPIGYGYLADRRIHRPEFEPLLLLSATGMALLGSANDLITLFVSLEILSIALYILCGLARRDRRSQESSIKYFVLGSVASAILLYGIALLYVATGSLEVPGIGGALGLVTTSQRVAALGLALVTVGIGFKVAMAPFQLWIADVYQGAPTNVTAFMAAATKAAAFAALLRLFVGAFTQLAHLWVPLLWALAAITMLYGAVVAIVQRDVKRILAYSSIAHAGYATIGVVANSAAGLTGTLWYLLTYSVTTLGAFGAVIALERRRRGEVALVDLRGLGRASPALAGILSLCLLSLAGIPPTAGFAGKLIVFQAGVAAGLEWLVVVGVVSSVVAAFFYLRLMGLMFLEDPDEGMQLPVVTSGLSAGTAAAAALVVYLGVQPDLVLRLAGAAATLAP